MSISPKPSTCRNSFAASILYLLSMGWVCLINSVWVLTNLFLAKDKSMRAFINHRLRRGALKVLKIANLKPELIIENELKLDSKTPYIYMSNHASLLDIPLIYALLPGTIRFIAKQELFKIPVFGLAIRKAEIISAKDPKLFEQIKTLMQNGVSIWFFPEGQRSKDGLLLSFKAGGFSLAREVGAKIIPVAICGTGESLPKGSFSLKRGIETKIRVGCPIDSACYAREQQSQLMNDVRNAVHQLMCLEQ